MPMNLIDYSRVFGAASFAERPFTSVDAAVLSGLSYAAFERIAPDYREKDKTLFLKDLSDEDITTLTSIKNYGPETRDLLLALRDAKRFKETGVKLVMKVTESDYLEQFCAMTFVLPNGTLFIAYRGTDSSAIGWEENFRNLYVKVTAAQLDSIEYLRIVREALPDQNFLLGGHSKGGNLSFYAILNAPAEIQEHISLAYSFDGTGFYSKDFRTQPDYNEKLQRMVQIVPKDTIVGEFFYTPNNQQVVLAEGKGIIQHDIFRWIITDQGDFSYTERRSFMSRLVHRTVKKWSQKASLSDRELFVKVIVGAFAGEDGYFRIYGNDSYGRRKRVQKELKEHYSKEEQKQFKKAATLFLRTMIRAQFYYIGKGITYPIRKLAKQVKK